MALVLPILAGLEGTCRGETSFQVPHIWTLFLLTGRGEETRGEDGKDLRLADTRFCAKKRREPFFGSGDTTHFFSPLTPESLLRLKKDLDFFFGSLFSHLLLPKTLLAFFLKGGKEAFFPCSFKNKDFRGNVKGSSACFYHNEEHMEKNEHRPSHSLPQPDQHTQRTKKVKACVDSL